VHVDDIPDEEPSAAEVSQDKPLDVATLPSHLEEPTDVKHVEVIE